MNASPQGAYSPLDESRRMLLCAIHEDAMLDVLKILPDEFFSFSEPEQTSVFKRMLHAANRNVSDPIRLVEIGMSTQEFSSVNA